MTELIEKKPGFSCQKKMIGKRLVNLLKKLLDLYAMSHYPEYPVMDEDGQIIGHEFYSTRGGTVTFVEHEDESTSEEDE